MPGDQERSSHITNAQSHVQQAIPGEVLRQKPQPPPQLAAHLYGGSKGAVHGNAASHAHGLVSVGHADEVHRGQHHATSHIRQLRVPTQ